MSNVPTTQIAAEQHADYGRRSQQWKKVRAALEGEDVIKDAGSAYLPRPSGMDNDAFRAYVERASFFPVAERTLRGMTGLVFRHDPQLEGPDSLLKMRENLTTDGYSFEVLTAEVLQEVLSLGRYGMLLDFGKDAKSTDLPYIASYFAEDIVNWTQEFRNGRKVLTRLVLKDDIDNTGEEDAHRYLELLINDDGHYEVRVWELQVEAEGAGKGQYIVSSTSFPSVGGKPLTEIPFVFVNPYDLRPTIEKPPMVDLVNVNLGHYRNSADYEHALFLTAQPTPWCSGIDSEADKPTAIGSGTIWFLPKEAAAGMLEFTGAGIESQRKAMEDKENRMAALGARMIHEGRNRNEASDTARMRGRGELSLLTTCVNMVESALTQIFQIAARWTGGDENKVDVKLNRDWIETRLDAQELTALVQALQSGSISRQTFHENLQAGEIIPVDRSADDEWDMIDEEAPTDLATPPSAGVADEPAQPAAQAAAQAGAE